MHILQRAESCAALLRSTVIGRRTESPRLLDLSVSLPSPPPPPRTQLFPPLILPPSTAIIAKSSPSCTSEETPSHNPLYPNKQPVCCTPLRLCFNAQKVVRYCRQTLLSVVARRDSPPSCCSSAVVTPSPLDQTFPTLNIATFNRKRVKSSPRCRGIKRQPGVQLNRCFASGSAL